MAKKITVSAPDVDKKTLEEAYAAWGTTREEHLAKMKKFIEREKAEAGKPHATAPVVYIDRRAAASKPAAHKPVAYGRAKGVAARTGGWTLAKRLFAVKKTGYGSSSVVQVINRRLKELEAQGVNVEKLLKGGSEGPGLMIGSGMSAVKRVYGRNVVKGKGGKGGRFRGRKGPKF